MGVAPPNAYNSPGSPKRKKKSSGGSNFITDMLKSAGGTLTNILESSNPMSLAEAIESQAAMQQKQADAKALTLGGTSIDPYTALQNSLYDTVNSISVAPTPLEQLQKMAREQVSAQYDPQLNALGRQMAQHTERAGKSSKQARDMYGALAKDYLAQLPEITAQYKAEDDSTNARYDQAQQQMNAEYQKNASQQDAVLQQLGIQAAAPDASQQAKDDQAYFQNQSNLEQQTALDALNQQQMAQTDYSRNLANNSRMAGENTAQDIQSQLREYLGEAEGQQSALEASKQSAIAALVAQMQQQDAQRVQTQQQQQFDNQMKLFNFQLSAQKAAADAADQSNGSAGGFGSGDGVASLTSGLPGAQNYLASVFPDQPIRASNLMELLNNVISDPTVAKGKFILDPGDESLGRAPKYSDVGQQYMERLLRKEFQGQGSRYGNNDINATLAALEAYLGKLR